MDASHEQQATAARTGDGVRPQLAELVALRAAVTGRRSARHGRYGVSGHALSPLRGRGMEYAESREYVAGDDARHIDWRLTARTGRAHTKLFQAERERLSLIVADTAPALYFGTRVRFKSVQAARAGAIAAWAAARDGDRIAALRGSVREPPVAPASGARGALRVLDALVRWYAQAPEEDAGLAVALDHAARLLRPGSRLLVLADPHSIAAIPEQRWSVLAQHHEVIVLLLTDPLEAAPPTAGGVMAAAPLLLRDIHQPPAPPWWPPAPGWWLLAAMLFLVAAGIWWWRARRRRRRAAIVAVFDAAVPVAASPTEQIAAMSELLRRAARRRDPQADRLQGEAWLSFLDAGSKQPRFAGDAGRLLLEGGYRRDADPRAVAGLRELARARFLEWMAAR